jgi:hypothetical protein
MMDKNTGRQFQAADAAIESAVTACMSKIEQMIGRWEAVRSTYIVEGTLLALCDGMTKLIDDPILADMAGPAGLKLSNALADYRDSLPSERYWM